MLIRTVAITEMLCGAGVALTGLLPLSAGISFANPGPMDPGYCGAHAPIDCVPFDGPTPPPPTPAESKFVSDARFYRPNADSATLLRYGRGMCLALHSGVITASVVSDVSSGLAISKGAAGQMMDTAMSDICPDVHIGANGADDSRPYH